MDTAFFTQLLTAYFDNPVVTSFKLMTQGKENTTALVETGAGKIIVRIWGETHGYMDGHSDNDITDEVAFMDFCHSKGVPVPQLFRSKSGSLYKKTADGQAYAVMEFVDGQTPTNFTSDMAAQIASTMARMHLIVQDFAFPAPRSWPGSVIDMTNDRIARFEAGDFALNGSDAALVRQATHQYRALLAECNVDALPTGIIHGDIMWENIKFKDGQLHGIFDFGDCRESYFIEDIVKSLLFVFESPEESLFGKDGQNVAIFLQAYQQIRPLTEAEKQSLPMFFLNRFLYQVLGYCAKVAKGQTKYNARIADLIARYKQHQGFFTQAKNYEA